MKKPASWGGGASEMAKNCENCSESGGMANGMKLASLAAIIMAWL